MYVMIIWTVSANLYLKSNPNLNSKTIIEQRHTLKNAFCNPRNWPFTSREKSETKDNDFKVFPFYYFFLLPLSLLLKSHLSKPQRSSWYIGCRFPCCNQTNDNKTDLAEAEMGAKNRPPKRHFNWRHHLQLEKQRKRVKTWIITWPAMKLKELPE